MYDFIQNPTMNEGTYFIMVVTSENIATVCSRQIQDRQQSMVCGYARLRERKPAVYSRFSILFKLMARVEALCSRADVVG